MVFVKGIVGGPARSCTGDGTLDVEGSAAVETVRDVETVVETAA